MVSLAFKIMVSTIVILYVMIDGHLVDCWDVDSAIEVVLNDCC